MVFLFGLFALAVVEIWVALLVAEQIGALWTVLAIVAMSALGVFLLKREGREVWRAANAEAAAGRVPTRHLLDGAMVLIGGTLLVIPGFVTGVIGLLLLLPPVRAVLRPALLAWLTARTARAMKSGRMQGVFIDTTVSPDGTVRSQTSRFGDVIEGEGEEIELPRGELPPTPPAPPAPPGRD